MGKFLSESGLKTLWNRITTSFLTSGATNATSATIDTLASKIPSTETIDESTSYIPVITKQGNNGANSVTASTIPYSKITENVVKSVNNAAPDENGNIELEILQGFEVEETEDAFILKSATPTPSQNYTKAETDEKLSLKQDKLKAGANINIADDGTISAVGGGSGSTNLYSERGQQTDGAPTNKLLDDELSNKADLLDVKNVELTTTSNKLYIVTNVGVGNVVKLTPKASTSTFRYFIHECKEGDQVIVNGQGGNEPRLWAFIDADNILLSVAEANATAKGLRLIAPTRTAKVIINDSTGATSYIGRSNNISEQIEQLANKSIAFDSDTYEGEANGNKLQFIKSIIARDKQLFGNAEYEGGVAELYLINDTSNYFCCKYYTNQLVVRSIISSGNYKWVSKTAMASYKNGIVYEIRITDDLPEGSEYSVGDVVGYILFRDVDLFKSFGRSANTSNVDAVVAKDISNAPIIATSISVVKYPYVNGDTIHLPYKINSPTIEELRNGTNNINVLFVGNSSTANAVTYAPFILMDMCPNLRFKLGVLFLDGGSISDHIANTTKEPYVGENGNVRNPQNYNVIATITNEMSAWQRTANAPYDTGVDSAVWDIVSTHQSFSHQSFPAEEMSQRNLPFFNKFFDCMADRLGYPVRFALECTHVGKKNTYESERTIFLERSEVYRYAMDKSVASILFPCGIAVENLKTIERFRSLGDNGSLTVDGTHLQSGIGQLCEAYVIAYMIAELAGEKPKMIGNGTIPSTEFTQSINIIRQGDIGSGAIGATIENIRLAQYAATMAIKNPYEITDLNIFDNL